MKFKNIMAVSLETLKPKNNVLTVNHCAGSTMLSGCFAVRGTCRLYKVEVIIKEDDLQILQFHLISTDC